MSDVLNRDDCVDRLGLRTMMILDIDHHNGYCYYFLSYLKMIAATKLAISSMLLQATRSRGVQSNDEQV